MDLYVASVNPRGIIFIVTFLPCVIKYVLLCFDLHMYELQQWHAIPQEGLCYYQYHGSCC